MRPIEKLDECWNRDQRDFESSREAYAVGYKAALREVHSAMKEAMAKFKPPEFPWWLTIGHTQIGLKEGAMLLATATVVVCVVVYGFSVFNPRQ